MEVDAEEPYCTYSASAETAKGQLVVQLDPAYLLFCLLSACYPPSMPLYAHSIRQDINKRWHHIPGQYIYFLCRSLSRRYVFPDLLSCIHTALTQQQQQQAGAVGAPSLAQLEVLVQQKGVSRDTLRQVKDVLLGHWVLGSVLVCMSGF